MEKVTAFCWFSWVGASFIFKYHFPSFCVVSALCGDKCILSCVRGWEEGRGMKHLFGRCLKLCSVTWCRSSQLYVMTTKIKDWEKTLWNFSFRSIFLFPFFFSVSLILNFLSDMSCFVFFLSCFFFSLSIIDFFLSYSLSFLLCLLFFLFYLSIFFD